MTTQHEWPLWEVFVRTKAGLDHKHCGSLHATDAKMALHMARDVYTRRQEGCSLWVVRSDQIVASDPGVPLQRAVDVIDVLNAQGLNKVSLREARQFK
mgnify:CR=1 FL=1